MERAAAGETFQVSRRGRPYGQARPVRTGGTRPAAVIPTWA
jgi:hypothetical protein